MKSKVLVPFPDKQFKEIQSHVREIRRAYDWPGVDYHDNGEQNNNLFNRWYWHNLPLLVKMHHDPDFIKKVSETAGEPLKPSYVFLSMYGPEGVCPLHRDRPQCMFTVDLVIDQDAMWPIYVEERSAPPKNATEDGPMIKHCLQIGEALFYSGTTQKHFRKPMREDSSATHCSLAFFHFVRTNWMGKKD